MKLGLLMEAAQTHQALAESSLKALQERLQVLDMVVREQVQQSCVEAFGAVMGESSRAAEALRALRRAVNCRAMLWSGATTVLCTVIVLGLAGWILPSPAEIAHLQTRRDELSQIIAGLEQRGAGLDWRRCGATQRLCVRVDLEVPAYGKHGDYRVVVVQ